MAIRQYYMQLKLDKQTKFHIDNEKKEIEHFYRDRFTKSCEYGTKYCIFAIKKSRAQKRNLAFTRNMV